MYSYDQKMCLKWCKFLCSDKKKSYIKYSRFIFVPLFSLIFKRSVFTDKCFEQLSRASMNISYACAGNGKCDENS